MIKRLLVLSVFCGFCLLGCEGKEGPAGPPGSGLPSFSARIENPNSFWVEAANPTINYAASNETAVASGPATIDWGRTLFKFNPASIPQNAQVTGAYVELTTKTMTLASGSVTFGLHQMLCDWSLVFASWNESDSGTAWGACLSAPTSAPLTRGQSFSSTVLSSVTFPSTQAPAQRFAWSLPTSMVQGWVNGTNSNYGLVLVSEGEGVDPVCSMTFFVNDGTIPPPTLVVTYTIP